MSKDRRVSIGPCPVAMYPITVYSRISRSELETAWQLVGPTVERNIDRPLWMQLAVAYIEGLNHGSGAERERAALNIAGKYW